MALHDDVDDTPTTERSGVLAGDPALARERDTALGALTLVRSRGLAPLLRAVPVGDAHLLTHAAPTGAVGLDELRARVPLRPGHVVTVLLAVLEALDPLHVAGLAHGGVAATRVLVAPDGHVVLAGSGLAWGVPPGLAGGPRPEADLAAVAVLARELLGAGTAPAPLVLALLRAEDAGSDTAGLAAALVAAVRPEPLLDLLWVAAASGGAATRPVQAEATPAVLEDVPPTSARATAARSETVASGVVPPSRVPRPRRTRRATTSWARVGVVLACLLVLPLGVAALRLPSLASASVPATGAGPAPSPPPESSEPPASRSAPAAPTSATASRGPLPDTSWSDVLGVVDAGRLSALASGSSLALARWVDPQGSAWTADSALVSRVQASGARIEGGALVRLDVRPATVDSGTALLRVRDVRSAYTVTVGGRRTRVGARPAQWWDVTLARSGEGWRLRDVVAVDAPVDQ